MWEHLQQLKFNICRTLNILRGVAFFSRILYILDSSAYTYIRRIDNLDQLYNKLEQFERVGAKALEVMRKKSFLPQKSKVLRTWNLTEVSQLVGKSTKTIRDNEKKNSLSEPKIDPKNSKRFYNLKDINSIRSFFNINPQKPPSAPPAIIAFTNFKGGVAKTTSAVHAAHFFAKSGYKTLIIDTDSQASATSAFGYAPDEHIHDNQTLLPFFLGKTANLRDSILTTYWDGLDLIPANLKLYEIELELPTIKDRAANKGKKFNIYDILDEGLTQIYDDYDVIIIDCPPL
jgi:chromosome partitioning protein